MTAVDSKNDFTFPHFLSFLVHLYLAVRVATRRYAALYQVLKGQNGRRGRKQLYRWILEFQCLSETNHF